jgi:hypothetical protein
MRFFVVLGTTVAGIAVAYWTAIQPHHSFAPPQSAQGLLDKADLLSWENRWADARPYYAEAAKLFRNEGQVSESITKDPKRHSDRRS